jgi:hypothetical protein
VSILEDKAMFQMGRQLPIRISFLMPASRIREVLDSTTAQAARDTKIQRNFSRQ